MLEAAAPQLTEPEMQALYQRAISGDEAGVVSMALIEANLRKQRSTIKHHPNRRPPPPPPPPKGAPSTAPPKGGRASTPPPPAGIAFEIAPEITEIESSAAAATSSEGGGKRTVGKGANTLWQGSSGVKKVMERVHEENMIRSLFKVGELP